LTPTPVALAPTNFEQPRANQPRESACGAPAQHVIDSVVINKGLALSLAPRAENLAFSLRLVEADTAAHRTPVSQPESPRSQFHPDAHTEAHNETRNEVQSLAPATAAGEVAVRSTSLSWSEASVLPRLDTRADVQLTEPREAAPSSIVAAAHDLQPVPPDTPRASATSEILLQLGSKDQPTAIRVTDRAGAVNVSVHSADPELRSSLRSNLSDLASQLSHQGWKAEVVKTGTILTRAETSQDPRPDGQRSSSQQQSFTSGDRQSQRDRRANTNQWLTELEEQTSGNPSSPGGKN
jgi:hypothetical protein